MSAEANQPEPFAEYHLLFTKAPYVKHKSICECILIKLDYTYKRDTDSWTSQDGLISVWFDFSGLLTAIVRYSSMSTTAVCDQRGNPLKFLAQFLDIVASKKEVKEETD